MSSNQKPVKFPEQEEFLTLADYRLGQSLESGLEVAKQAAQEFVSMEEGSGLGLSKFLHGVNFRWKEFEREEGDTFTNWAHRATGRSEANIQRRVCIWEFLDGDYIPAQYKDNISSFSMRMLTKAYKVAVRHRKNKYDGNLVFAQTDYDIDWLALSECVDEPMVISVVDKITGKDPNSNRVSFAVDGVGDVWFYKGKKGSTVIGRLNTSSSSSLVQEGIDLLKERAKIKETGE